MLKKAAIGAADLSLEGLIAAVERVLAGLGYALEWVPGAVTGEYFAALHYLEWISEPGRGAWLVLPAEPHAGRIASALVGLLGRPLVYHATHWYSGPRGGDIGCASYLMQLDGTRTPRPTGLEYRDLDRITEGSPEDRLRGLIRHLIEIPDTPRAARHVFPIYEVAEGAGVVADEKADATEEISQERVDEALVLLRRPASRGMLRREGPGQSLLVIEGAEAWTISIYLDAPTADALVSASEREGLRLLARPSVGGPG